MAKQCLVHCRRCPNTFVAPSFRFKTCPKCKREIYEARIEEKRTEQPWHMSRKGRLVRPRQHKPRHLPPQLRDDFKLALEEMRRELERQCSGDGAIWVAPVDLTFLNNRRSA
jgi:hypothetical protein